MIVPNKILNAVVEAAIEKIPNVNTTREKLENGVLLGEVYAKYGVI